VTRGKGGRALSQELLSPRSGDCRADGGGALHEILWQKNSLGS